MPMAEISDVMSNDLGYNQLAEVMNSLAQGGKVKLDVANKRLIYIGGKGD